MRSIFDPAVRHSIARRFRDLTPGHTRKWGKLSTPEMLTHVSDQLRMAIGRLPASPIAGPLRHWPVNYLMVHMVPWPKGKAKGPREAFTTRPGNWEDDRATFLGLLEELGSADPGGTWPHHASFGRISGKDWGVLTWRHLHHHLTQFGA